MPLTFLSNLSFPAARVRLNEIFNAISTWNAGTTEPTDYQAHTPWLDTSDTTPLLKIRNPANSAWVTVTPARDGYRYIGTQILTSGTAAIYTPTAGTRLIRVMVFGASGGGGGADGQGAGTVASGGAGGNGGYVEKNFLTAGQTFTYTIGAAGIGGVVGAANGTAGGTTSFTASVDGTIQVTGGAGGTGDTGAATATSLQAVGGVGSGGVINKTGGRGVPAVWNGGSVFCFPNNGSPLEGNGAFIGSAGNGTTGALSAGGLGGFAPGTATNYSGGNGFRGEIRIEEYC